MSRKAGLFYLYLHDLWGNFSSQEQEDSDQEYSPSLTVGGKWTDGFVISNSLLPLYSVYAHTSAVDI